MKPYIYFQDNDNECYSKKLSEEVWRIQQLRILENTPQVGGFVKEQNTVWKWKEPQTEEVSRILIFQFVCSMNEEHHLDYIVLTTDNSMMKIGQYPSVADMTFPELDAYKHVISKEDRKELGTAIGPVSYTHLYASLDARYDGHKYPDRGLVQEAIHLMDDVLSQKKDNIALIERVLKKEDALFNNKEAMRCV